MLTYKLLFGKNNKKIKLPLKFENQTLNESHPEKYSMK